MAVSATSSLTDAKSPKSSMTGEEADVFGADKVVLLSILFLLFFVASLPVVIFTEFCFTYSDVASLSCFRISPSATSKLRSFPVSHELILLK